MTTAFAGIAAAIQSALQAATPVSAHVHRAKTRGLPEEWTDMVNIRLSSAARERFATQGGPCDWDTTVLVECSARSATDTPDDAVDALMSAVHARIQEDPTLNGLVMDLDLTNLDYDFDQQAENTAMVTLTYLVLHRTAHNALE